MGRVSDYVPGRPASYGRGRLGNETAKVAEEEGLACDGGTGRQESNAGSTRLRHTQGVLSRRGVEEDKKKKSNKQAFQEGILATVSNRREGLLKNVIFFKLLK